jgi:hypothetical protein
VNWTKTELKRGDVRVRTRRGFTALFWKDRWEVYMLTNMDPPPEKGSFCDEGNCPVKPHIVEWYNLTWIIWTVLNVWPTVIQSFDVPSGGPLNCFSTFWI